MELMFNSWSPTRRVRSLQIMDNYLAQHGDTYAVHTLWPRESEFLQMASDDTMYTNALFLFYLCLTTKECIDDLIGGKL